ncbi:MAG: hypothetical protein OEV73_00280 [Desulfobulbaceae bacterium]|nr:hypothetical protein [Desulfobulbaceae bacterium]
MANAHKTSHEFDQEAAALRRAKALTRNLCQRGCTPSTINLALAFLERQYNKHLTGQRRGGLPQAVAA